jgi:hypothetical protein
MIGCSLHFSNDVIFDIVLAATAELIFLIIASKIKSKNSQKFYPTIWWSDEKNKYFPV